MEAPSSPSSPGKKRKREAAPAEELEIDVTAPEPPSKRAQRRAKKGKLPLAKPRSPSPSKASGSDGEANATGVPAGSGAAAAKPSAQRGEHGVWIGNLPFSADKASLRAFLVEQSGGTVGDADITRVHLRAPSARDGGAAAAAGTAPNRARNRGFAYVDVTSTAAQIAVLALSESLMGGRRLLIKDARSFEGRPAKTAAATTAATTTSTGVDGEKRREGKPPNKRVFVGNLPFDADRDTLGEHLGACGTVEQVFLATFEDSGKCKGYAWVTFEDVESAQRAVTDRKARMWDGRRLRLEFAEEASVRYQKRFGRAKGEGET